jgi:hypothetical protein
MSDAASASTVVYAGGTPGSGSGHHTAFCYNGGIAVGMGASLPSCKVATGTDLGTIKLATYDGGTTSCFGIGVQGGMLTFGAGVAPASGAATMNLTSTGKLAIGTGNAASPACTLHVAAGGVFAGGGLFIEAADMTSLVNGAPYYGFGRNTTTGHTQMAGYGGCIIQTASFVTLQTGTRISFIPTAAANGLGFTTQPVRICEPSNNGNYGMAFGYGIQYFNPKYCGSIMVFDNNLAGTLNLNPNGGMVCISAPASIDSSQLVSNCVCIAYDYNNNRVVFYAKSGGITKSGIIAVS